MILVAFGANLPLPDGRSPRAGVAAALAALESRRIPITAISRWYASEPVPPSDQPWFVNGVCQIATDLPPAALLATLHGVEAELGRVRGAPNAARPIDLDLLIYGRHVQPGDPERGEPDLPHPRLRARAFVLYPLADLLPASWRHPATGERLADLLAALPDPGDKMAVIAERDARSA